MNIKRYLLLLGIMLCLSLSVDAQHLKFMGIPLNGSIDLFQQKLASKGMTPYKAFNATTPFGVRGFKGRFTGKICNIYVYYTNTKTVYRAQAVYSEETESVADSYYEKTKDLLDTKYIAENKEDDTSDGYPLHRIYVTDDDGINEIGQIVLVKSKYTDDYGSVTFSIHVDYYDNSNYDKHENDNLDDL